MNNKKTGLRLFVVHEFGLVFMASLAALLVFWRLGEVGEDKAVKIFFAFFLIPQPVFFWSYYLGRRVRGGGGKGDRK